jgi:AraC-like DNA-binding protein
MEVSIVNVWALLEAVECAGASGDDLLSRAAFERRRLDDKDDWIDAAEFDRLVDMAVEATADPAFGLHWGERATLMKYDVVAPLVAAARSLRTAAMDVLRFQRLLRDQAEVTFDESGAVAALSFATTGTSVTVRRVRTEAAVVGFVRMLEYFGGRDGSARRVSFAYPAPPYANEYERILGERVAFAEPCTRVEFAASLLDRPQVSWNARLYEALEAQALESLEKLTRGRMQSDRVRDHLARAFPAQPTMSETARGLGMSERALRRALLAETTTFQRLASETYSAIARRLLSDGAKSLKDVAYEMGFSDPTAFHRAFKRWSGESPGEFRRNVAKGR